MMSLFSSFNPVSTPNLAMNWMMLMPPIILMMNSLWILSSNFILIIKMFMYNIITQFKSSMSKINTPNLIMIMLIIIMITIYNITSLLPSSFSITSHIMINLSLALTLWMALMKKKTNNLTKLMSNLTPPNTPFLLIPFMVVIELVSLMIQPITLSIRLTANITAGHIMLVLISQLYSMMLIPTLMMNLMMMIMELGVSLIQAYVFSMLILMYMK